jgi:hypothetical protein
MIIGSSGSMLVSLKQGFEFESYKWRILLLEELYFLVGRPGSTGLVRV